MPLPSMPRSLLLVAACAAGLGQAASPAYPPASVQFTVHDEAGKPLAGASVRLSRIEGSLKADEAVVRTDADGKAKISRGMPANSRTWAEALTVEKPGSEAQSKQLNLFTGAQIEEALTLEKSRQTLFSVVGPDGRPAAGVALSLEGENVAGQMTLDRDWPSGVHTDEQGQYAWRHGALPTGFTVRVGGHVEKLPDAAAATLQLSTEELKSALLTRVHLLQGRLLLPSGSPAAGWFVATDVMAGAIWEDGAFTFLTLNVRSLNPVEKDGSFQAAVGPNLLVVSPEGVPVFFDLNPAMWEPGTRRITITLPPTHMNLEGQIVDEAGKSVPGLALRVDDVGAGLDTWSVTIAQEETARLAAAGIRFGVSTDAEGKYSIPVPSGVWGTIAPVNAEWRIEASHPPVQKLVRQSGLREATKPALPLKDVAVRFQDEVGGAIEAPGFSAKAYANKVASGAEYAGVDVRGTHFFVNPAVDQLEITLDGPDWNAATKSVHLDGAGDQTMAVTLESALRWKPAKGHILDAAGKAVANASVSPVRRVNENGRTIRSIVSRDVKSDAQGRFDFKGLPDSCELQVTRFDETGNSQDLPGWMDPVAITPATRDVEIHLKPAGSIRILLPENLLRDIGQVYLEKQNTELNDFMASAYLVADRPTHSLLARRAAPGTYKLRGTDFPEIGDAGDEPITVQEGREAVVDWTKRPFTQMSFAPENQAAISVTADGKPVSGAQVAIFTERWPDETVAQWIKEWRTADPATRAVIRKKIQSAAGPARELIAAMRGDDSVATASLAQTLGASGGWESDSLVQLTRDLSDDNGTVRFNAQPGRQYVAVALCAGKSIGWEHFTLAANAADFKIPSIEMKPTRAVAATLSPWASGPGFWDNRELHVRLVEPAGIDRRALMRMLAATLGGMDIRGIGDLKVQSDLSGRAPKAAGRIVEDLPIGATVEVRITSSGMPPEYQTVKINPGEGAIEFKTPNTQ